MILFRFRMKTGENIDYVTLGGVQANPTLAMAREGIELGKKEGVDFILAVGGGSVIDSAKCIAAYNEWLRYSTPVLPSDCQPEFSQCPHL